jgi:hypothetical protein
MAKPKSELLFEQFCREHEIRCVPVAQEPGRTPDYDVYFGNRQVAVEIKQVDPTPEEAAQIERWEAGEVLTFGGEAGKRVRQEITDARQQLRRAKGKYPALLVLYNNVEPISYTDPMFILLAMYGELTLPYTMPSGGGRPIAGDLRFGGKRRVTKTDNTTMSAVCVLNHDFNGHLILTFYHNYFAALPFDPTWFQGEHVRHYFLPKEQADSGNFGFWVDIEGKRA